MTVSPFRVPIFRVDLYASTLDVTRDGDIAATRNPRLRVPARFRKLSRSATMARRHDRPGRAAEADPGADAPVNRVETRSSAPS